MIYGIRLTGTFSTVWDVKADSIEDAYAQAEEYFYDEMSDQQAISNYEITDMELLDKYHEFQLEPIESEYE